GRARATVIRPHPDRRQARQQRLAALPRRGDGLSELRPLPAHERLRQPRFRHAGSWGVKRSRRAAGEGNSRGPRLGALAAAPAIHPASMFVAGFIGSPRMDFVPGRLASSAGKASVSFLGITSPLGTGALLTAGAASGDVTVGIRPEDFMCRPAAGPDCTLTLHAEVDVVEPMGHEAYVTALCAGETVTSRFPPRSGVRTQESVELALNPARLHLFDAQSGITILQRPVAAAAETLRSVGEARTNEPAEGRSERHRQPEAPVAPSRSEEIS